VSPPPASEHEVVVVGSGPNGLAAALTVAQAGRSVLVLEAHDEIGGGTRTAELTLPGFLHDVCSAVHPLGIASPFFRALPLAEKGVTWLHPPFPLAHPLDDGSAVVVQRSLEATAASLGRDGSAYTRLLGPLVREWQPLLDTFLGPLRSVRHPLLMARFGVPALAPAATLAKLFGRDATRALVAGLAAHAIQPLERAGTGAFALMLGTLAHAVGWPVPRGGARTLAAALRTLLEEHGGEVRTGREVLSVAEFPRARAILLDLAPRGVLRLAGATVPPRYRRALERYRYGPGVFKLDLALSEAVPWAAEACRRAGTVHVGGTLEEIARAERQVWRGVHPERPFVIVAQPSLVDDTRAPAGAHTLWAYCHVPHGSDVDMREPILAQIERFAPGFRRLVLAAHGTSAAAFGRYNPNYVGGDINTGVQDLRQQFARPVARWDPYATPDGRLFVCSAATPPGGGVHGMCGFGAARSALRRLGGA
jgi:phytoene dehydrogenase-like protein